ncbi:MAG TPA: hypothetical protein VLC09_07400 [Polyangiaceae bacterium]|nr:hypothetical protein [Polyangiaceae bacterium]
MNSLIRAGLALSLLLTLGSPARAQSAADRANAIDAFDTAQTLLEQGQTKEACSKFEESQKLDPQLGTLLYLADCYERNGQLASAWLGFREAGELAEKRNDPRRAVATERATALRPRLSQMKLELPAQLPTGTLIERNGATVSEAQWRASVALDPGTYRIVVSAPNHESFQGSVEVKGEGAMTTLTVPPLVPTTSTGPAPVAPTETSDSQSVWQAKWPAPVAAGVGLGGAVVWTIFGIQSLDAKSQAEQGCATVNGVYTCSTTEAQQASQDAVAAGDVATIGMIVAGVGFATAGVLWFTLPDGSAPSSDTAVPRRPSFEVGVRPLGAELRGSF